MSPKPPKVPLPTLHHHKDCLLSFLNTQQSPPTTDAGPDSSASASMSISTLSNDSHPFTSHPTRPTPREPSIPPPIGPGEPRITQSIPITAPWEQNLAPRFRPATKGRTGRRFSAFTFDPRSRRVEQFELAPLSPRSLEPQAPLLPSELVMELFDGQSDIPTSDLDALSSCPGVYGSSGDDSTTPTQTTLLYHSGGNFFLPYPVTPTGNTEMPCPRTPRANAWPPELLSPCLEQVEMTEEQRWEDVRMACWSGDAVQVGERVGLVMPYVAFGAQG